MTDGEPRNPATRWIIGGAVALVLGAGLVLVLARPEPPPADVADDALLSKGRDVYVSRCISCHGPDGRGDGPIVGTLTGPPPRDFTAPWKYGERAEDVLAVVRKGVPDTTMSGWASYLPDDDIRAVSAYVFHLGRRPVPTGL